MSTDADLQAEIARAAKTLAGVSAAASTISILESGLQIFMAIYGLSVWLDTSEEQRKRRLPYILLSFSILFLSVIPTYLGVADEFKVLYNSGPGIEYLDMKDAARSKWNQMLSYALIFAGNSGVLVSGSLVLYRCNLVRYDLRWIIILPRAIYLVLNGLSAYTLYEISKLDQNATANVHLSVAMLLLNVIFYILVTSLIIFRLLRGHSAVAKVLPGRSFTAHRGAISILVESALPLTICGFISGVVNAHINIGKGTQNWVTMFAVGYIFDALSTC
ncbi:hypothetical protein CC1G_05936 [Coprinopsis cinerea okayama7|uniref:Uncharacterized protein n=1 Tax=Coprinopsis cinerea (strain Okayama-7 / 130 / ATCC MYA-4618 / FGSC 9003) TaxID=240176 RepID=A8NAI5_COPC7|nr:hypothetical protein CC1G_05936 [Coprinopsis cinerea okayama7\|eukprot:XP_001831837.2 hypothetical protein CC1G_05936 [Coprinopsis cinerea okayama7\